VQSSRLLSTFTEAPAQGNASPPGDREPTKRFGQKKSFNPKISLDK